MTAEAPRILARCWWCGTFVTFDPAGPFAHVVVNFKKFAICQRCAQFDRR